MKNFKKILALALTAIMVLGMSTMAFAAGTGTITITVPTEEQAPTVATTYEIYKVFDADGNGTAISYKLVNGKTTAPDGFSVDAAGNVTYAGAEGATELTADDIAAIAEYVADDDPVATVTAAVGETSVVAENLPNGYYYITTTTGSVVTIDSTNPDAEVIDKNVIPSVVKSAGTQYDAASLAAIAAVGTDQSYTAVINAGKGAKNVVFKDEMTNQTYNGDAKVYVGGTEVAAGNTTFSISGAAGDSSFTIKFVDSYIAGLEAGTEITVKYSGKITSDALSTNPATNKATLTSGEGNESESEEVEVYNAKISIIKQDDKEVPLAGAGFVLKNSEDKYYKLVAASNDAPAHIEWVDSIDDADEHVSGDDGNVPAFTGLADGEYTWVEKTTPAGYKTAVADTPFSIEAGVYTAENLEQSAIVPNTPGSELPSTGGIGTTIFYVLGSILVIGAGVLLVTKRRMDV